MQPQTRVDAVKLQEAVEEATKLLQQVEAILAPYFVVLTDKERQTMPKAREGFEPAGRAIARAVAKFPEIGAVAGLDPEAVTEDLDNAVAIAPLAERTAVLSRRLADSRLTWLAEAWSPSLTAYGIAKVLARKDGKVREVIEPLASVFSVRRPRTEEQSE